jgi:hypothetical protein
MPKYSRLSVLGRGCSNFVKIQISEVIRILVKGTLSRINTVSLIYGVEYLVRSRVQSIGDIFFFPSRPVPLLPGYFQFVLCHAVGTQMVKVQVSRRYSILELLSSEYIPLGFAKKQGQGA